MLLRLVLPLIAIAAAAGAAEKRTILAVFAHPDDETVAGPLLARYAKEGHAVHLVTLTAGQKGTAPHANIPAGAALAAARGKELGCAAEQLGLAGHTLLEFEDQGFAVGWDAKPMNAAATRVREAIDKVKPDVVITWGPDGGSGHPDHRTASNVTTQAFQQRSAIKHHPAKLYYVAFPDVPSGAPDMSTDRRVSEEFITTVVDGSGFVGQAMKAVECHKSQWSAEQMAGIRKMIDDRKGRVMLRLAMSTVGPAASREQDVFERLR